MRGLAQSGRLPLSQAAGQLALLIAIPVIARNVEPDVVGAFQVASAVSLIIQPLATLRLEYLIPVTRGLPMLRRRRRVALAGGGVATILAGLTGALLFLTQNSSIAEICLVLSVVLPAYVISAVENAYLLRLQEVRILVRRNLVSGCMAALLQIVAAFVWPTSLALGLSLVVGRLFAIVVCGRPRRPRQDVYEPSGDSDERASFTERVHAIVAGTISNGATQITILCVGWLFGLTAAGQLGLAQRVAGVPTALLGQGLSQMLMSTAGPLIRMSQPGVRGQVKRMIRRLVPLVLAFAILGAVAGPTMIPAVLGSTWRDAGAYFALLSLPIGLQLIAVAILPVLIAVQKSATLLRIQAIRLFGVLAALVVAWACNWGVLAAIVAVSVAMVITYLQAIAACLAALKRHEAGLDACRLTSRR
ncbi:oligosaccharide flippase family protein [Geodermatophilus sp. SYSU D00708]